MISVVLLLLSMASQANATEVASEPSTLAKPGEVRITAMNGDFFRNPLRVQVTFTDGNYQEFQFLPLQAHLAMSSLEKVQEQYAHILEVAGGLRRLVELRYDSGTKFLSIFITNETYE